MTAGIVLVLSSLATVQFVRALVCVARSREFLEVEQLREARQLRRLSRRGK
jgi:hypothetical protein